MAIRQIKHSIVVLALFFAFAEAQDDWVKEGMLSAPDISVSGKDVTIAVQSVAGGCWIGCSIKLETWNDWYDLPAQKCSFTDPFHYFSWTAPIAGRYKGTVALWKKRVDRCGCVYCKRNGYHLEGELLRHNFTFEVK